MKKCYKCNITYEDDNKIICDSCGDRLERITTNLDSSPKIIVKHDLPSGEQTNNLPPIFEQRSGTNIIIRGIVVGHNTQQFYQSSLTKILRSVFGGEPYQLSHTSFVNTYRVQEIAIGRFPENERDVVVYGSLRNIIQDGDDITVTAHRNSGYLVASRIYSNSTNSFIRIENNIPCWTVRLLLILIIFAIVSLFTALINIDYAELSKLLIDKITIPIIVIATLYYFFKKFIKGE